MTTAGPSTNTADAYRLHGDVAVLTLVNPPVNGLGHALRCAIVAGIERANADPAVRAIVVTGSGNVFSAGADVREFGTPLATAEPTLNATIRIVEASAKPVIAAIGGTCMGGGLELALGCHYRVATRAAPLALPEVKLGLIPGAGGTQRLPRAIGVEAALDMILSASARNAGRFEHTALLDVVVDAAVLDGALAFARTVIDEGRPVKRLRDLAVASHDGAAAVRAARDALAAAAISLPAPRHAVDAVAAAISMTFDDGMAFERRAFLELVASPESHALRHAFFAERAAARIADVPDTIVPRVVERIAVIGGGTMGRGIAMCGVNVGIPVVLLEMDTAALQRAVVAIRAVYEGAVAKGKLSGAELDRRVGLLEPSLVYADVHDCDLVIEAVFEDMAIKQAVFAELDRVAKPGAILATNTSTLDVDRLAQMTTRPGDVVGLHFFSPAHVMKLLEVVRGGQTTAEVLATAMKLARRLGKTAVVSRVCDGFIGNRMIEHYLRQAMLLVEDGATPGAVDAALERFGMAMGPFRMSDVVGLDVGWRIRQRRYVERPQVPWPRIGDHLYEQGRLGQKVGAGWYRYAEGRREALPDPDVDALVAAYRGARGSVPRQIDDEEIVDRCILALVNEGARVLEEGIAQRASDIDVVYMAGYGFPRHRGGPMFYADRRGLAGVARRMRELAAASGPDRTFWTPAPLLDRLASEGAAFNAMPGR